MDGLERHSQLHKPSMERSHDHSIGALIGTMRSILGKCKPKKIIFSEIEYLYETIAYEKDSKKIHVTLNVDVSK